MIISETMLTAILDAVVKRIPQETIDKVAKFVTDNIGIVDETKARLTSIETTNSEILELLKNGNRSNRKSIPIGPPAGRPDEQ